MAQQYQLPAEVQKMLADGERKLMESEELIRKASAAGIDCQAQDLYCQALRQRYEGIRREFGRRVKE